jgi:hypothetical protein
MVGVDQARLMQGQCLNRQDNTGVLHSLPFYSMQREGSGYSVRMYEKWKENTLRCSLLLAFLLARAFAQLSWWWWCAVAVDDAVRPYPDTVS